MSKTDGTLDTNPGAFQLRDQLVAGGREQQHLAERQTPNFQSWHGHHRIIGTTGYPGESF
jgi:hypothetical protein